MNKKIIYNKPGHDAHCTGITIKVYEEGRFAKYLVKIDDPIPGQPNTCFVFWPEIVEIEK